MSSIVLWALFLISAVIITGLGLLLIILGIVQKKAGQWVPGILITTIAMIFGVAGFVYVIGKTANTNNHNSSNYYDYNNPPQDNRYNNEEADTTENNNDAVEAENDKYITGFIQDIDKSLIHIKIIPDPILKDLGININKIDTYVVNANAGKVIPLNITFSKKFKGTLQLLLFSSDNEEINRSFLQINQNENSTFTVKFLFDKETNFLKTSYARLKSSD